MARQHLDAVEPGLGEARGGPPARLDDLSDQISRHLPRHGVKAVVGHRRGGICHAPHAGLAASGAAPGMGKLAEDARAMAVHRRCKAAIAWNTLVARDHDLGRVAKGALVVARRLDDDKAGPATGPGFVIGDEVAADEAALGEVGLMPRRQDAVSDLQTAQVERREKVFEAGHGGIPVLRRPHYRPGYPVGGNRPRLIPRPNTRAAKAEHPSALRWAVARSCRLTSRSADGCGSRSSRRCAAGAAAGRPGRRDGRRRPPADRVP
jgi:hypothetical protein